MATTAKTKTARAGAVGLVAIVAALVVWRVGFGGGVGAGDDAGRARAAAAELAARSAAGSRGAPGALVGGASRRGVTPIVGRPFHDTESAPASAPADGFGRLVVTVVWEVDGSPAVGTPVEIIRAIRQDPHLHRLRLRTDAMGQLRVPHLPVGPVSAIPVWGGRGDATIEAGKETAVTVKIPPGPAIEGIVVDAAARPVSGAEILWYDFGNLSEAVVVAISAGDGTFRLRSTSNEPVFLVGARAAGFLPAPVFMLRNLPGAVMRVRLVIGERGVEVAGHVFDQTGVPVAGAVVRLGTNPARQFAHPDGTMGFETASFRTVTDADGAFRLDGLKPRTTRLAVRADHHAPWAQEIEVGSAAARALRVELADGATIVGRVVDAADKPVAGVEITAGESSPHDTGGFSEATCKTSRDGTFRLDGVAVGDVNITADAGVKGRASATLRTMVGQTTEWLARLKAGGEIRGRIVDERELPIASCRVYLESTDTGAYDQKFLTSDAAGKFAAADCRANRYRLDVLDPNAARSTMASVEGVQPGGAEIVIRVRDDARATGFITGVVVGSDGRAVAATVNAMRGDRGHVASATADAKTGAFTIGPLAPDTYAAGAKAPGFPFRMRRGLVVERDKTLDIGTIQLEVGGTLVVALTREGGGPIGDANIWARTTDGLGGGGLGITGSEARSEPLAAGAYLLHVSGKDLVTQELPCQIRAGETTEMKVTLLAGIHLVLDFDDPPNVPLSRNIRVTVRDSAGTVVFQSAGERYESHPIHVEAGLRRGTCRLEAVAADTGRRVDTELIVPPAAGGDRVSFTLR